MLLLMVVEAYAQLACGYGMASVNLIGNMIKFNNVNHCYYGIFLSATVVI